VQDSRLEEEQFSLEVQGFTWLLCPSEYIQVASSFENASSPGDTVMSYLKETISFVKKATGAQRVIAFDWRVSTTSWALGPSHRCLSSVEMERFLGSLRSGTT
jgi:hypothetical protein